MVPSAETNDRNVSCRGHVARRLPLWHRKVHVFNTGYLLVGKPSTRGNTNLAPDAREDMLWIYDGCAISSPLPSTEASAFCFRPSIDCPTHADSSAAGVDGSSKLRCLSERHAAQSDRRRQAVANGREQDPRRHGGSVEFAWLPRNIAQIWHDKLIHCIFLRQCSFPSIRPRCGNGFNAHASRCGHGVHSAPRIDEKNCASGLKLLCETRQKHGLVGFPY